MATKEIDPIILQKIVKAIEEIEYGSVEVVIHDSQVTQIERLEKQRFPLQKGSRQ